MHLQRIPTQLNLATFSIVAYDPANKEWGAAVQSKFLAVGAVVTWARAGAGVVATQSYANMAYGPQGLDLMERGLSASEVIQKLTGEDEGRDLRQVGMVDRSGGAASYTGKGCFDWAGHIVGEGFACQGNILVKGTVEAMAARFELARQEGRVELADWLVSALAAGQEAGGDRRGRQAAAVLVVREDGGYGGNNDRYLDLRVDDDPEPISRLGQLVELHHLYYGKVKPEDLIPLSSVTTELQEILVRTGYYQGPVNNIFDETVRRALRAMVGAENLEERWNGEGEMIDRKVVEFIKGKYGHGTL
jgi:uncharacterized Ntn-hydrolase superfamily protein